MNLQDRRNIIIEKMLYVTDENVIENVEKALDNGISSAELTSDQKLAIDAGLKSLKADQSSSSNEVHSRITERFPFLK